MPDAELGASFALVSHPTEYLAPRKVEPSLSNRYLVNVSSRYNDI